MDSYYTSTNAVLEAIESSEPIFDYVPDPEDCERSGERLYHGRRVTWRLTSAYTVLVDVEKIVFMEGNAWDFNHGAGLYQAARSGEACFECPAARVYRITASDVRTTERYYEEDELEYQMGMERPWNRNDVGDLHAQLLDGNHRAAAAMLVGEEVVPVIVGESYRKDILKKEWLVPRSWLKKMF